MHKLYNFVRPAVFKIDPETAHNMTIKALKAGLVKTSNVSSSPKLRQTIFDLHFDNPIGLSAGFDKNAEVVVPILKLGFGFTEVGTVTPKPQLGNARPRVFRDLESEAVINRMGFPNGGLRVFKPNLTKARNNPSRPDDGIIGVNIGMNKNQPNPVDDYRSLIKELATESDYITINISSPNTPGLRDLQEKEPLTELLKALSKALRQTSNHPPALLVKLAPDLTEEQQKEIAETLMEQNVSGVILANTTLDRPSSLNSEFRDQKGGLSGAPVREKSTDIIRNFYKLTKGQLPIIGVGGISTAEHAYEKIRAGASLLQLYTGMIYQGPEIANNINAGLVTLLEKDGFRSISDAIGVDT